ncbi:glycosyltransferase [Paracoccus sp. (in: a-proteobacteria)]|uniref:glycosyltransferase n=1 Tax=Paracoccus sp. TaxID=267 RepID=UPI00396C6BBF
MLVTYLAHDLDDPSIWRRVEMLRRGGAQVRVAGFRRAEGPLAEPAIVIGKTANGRMGQRLRAIARVLPRIDRLVPRPASGEPEVILARNLEMLMLGAMLQRRRPARLVYELLDIHSMMLGDSLKARALRRVEAGLMRASALVAVSSPAFVSRYLQAYGQPATPTLLVENKPFADVMPAGGASAVPHQAAPLVIGWFGMLRCRFSLMALDRLTRDHPGRFRVILRGRPALDVLEDFHAVVEANPDLHYPGPYRWPDDLASIYGEVDLAWLIDRYQAGQNSDWLLPNRLYEGCLNGAVPVVLKGTEVARRVEAWSCGILLEAPEDEAIRDGLTGVMPADLARCHAALADIPRNRLQMDSDECMSLTAAICGTDESHRREIAA